MANQKLTDKTELAEQAGSGDLLMVVDVNDTTGSSSGTSKKQDFKYLMQTDKFSLSNAEVLALDTTPKTLVGALSGYMPTIFNVTVLCTYGASTENSRKDLIFGFDESVDAEYWAYVESCMDGETTDTTYIPGPSNTGKLGSCSSSILNKPFKVWAEGTGFAGGWSCDIYVTYCYTKVL
tara:strand:- start:354 stop:890 length:537 start_codon:yes stop_codon:yes gene_type:complete